MSEIGQLSGHAVLAQMSARYEALIRDFGLLKQLEDLESESLSGDDACTRLVALVTLEGIAEYCSIMLLDEQASYLELRAVSTRYSTQGFSVGSDIWQGKRFALGEGVAGQVASTRVHVRIDDTLTNAQFLRIPDSQITVRSLMCFPLIDCGELIGVLNMSHSDPGFFDADRENAMKLVSRRIARILGPALSAARAPETDTRGSDTLLMRDPQGAVLQISENAQWLTGISATQWRDGTAKWRDHVAVDDRDAYDDYYRSLSQGLPNDGVTYTFSVGNGMTRQLHEFALPIPEPNNAGGWIALVQDVARSEGLNRWSSNQAAAKMLHAQRVHTVGQLAGGIVHDLNSLLTGIVGNLDLALVSNSTEESRELVSRARKASIRGADIVNKVLAFGSVENETGAPVPVALADVLEDAVGVLRCSFDPRIALEVSIPDSLHPVCADAEQLNQVLVNLGVNARDALEQRGVNGASSTWQLKIGAENVRLDRTMTGPWGSNLEGDFVRLYVTDNGVGMTPDVLARIYEPFFTTKSQGKGTGLGLSTVYRIVRHHRGWIDVNSTPRKGTTFSIYLPACPPEVLPTHDETPEATTSDLPCILLVDDEALVRNLGAAILKRLGYDPIIAHDGRDGLEKFAANRDKIDLVILDLQMPDMGGEMVLKHMREQQPDLPIIYSTGMSYYETRDLPENMRPSGFLKKPYLIATMAEVIREALNRPH